VITPVKVIGSCGWSFLKVHTRLSITKYRAPDFELVGAALAVQLSSGFLSAYTDGREGRIKYLPFPPPHLSDKQFPFL